MPSYATDLNFLRGSPYRGGGGADDERTYEEEEEEAGGDALETCGSYDYEETTRNATYDLLVGAEIVISDRDDAGTGASRARENAAYADNTPRAPSDGRFEADGGNATDYASSVSLSRMLYGKDLSEWIARRRPGVTAERQCGGPVTFPPPGSAGERKITVVRAPMGSGKTTALIEWLRAALSTPNKSALVVSCRRSFTHTLERRFNDAGLVGFVTYFASADYIIHGAEYRRLIVQAESLHRVDRALMDRYDVLVLDEAMSTIGQLFSPTMRKLKIVDVALTRLMASCPRVMAMDATANAQLVDVACELVGETQVHVIIGEYAAPGFAERRCTVLRQLGAELLERDERERVSRDSEEPTEEGTARAAGTRGSFLDRLAERLRAGDNVCVFSSTMAFSETAAAFCATVLDDAGAVLLLNSETAEPVDVGSWSAYRAVVYTTVVTVGLSFDERHFRSLFAYVKPTGHGPDMASVYQSLGRVRTLEANEVFLYFDGSAARCEAVFTPMLLNHVVANNGGGWPSSYEQLTNVACCAFRRDCAPVFDAVDGAFLFKRFKYKHLFERCTLASLGDSVNILHALLEANNMTVVFERRGGGECLAAVDREAFEQLLRDLRSDALRAQRFLRNAKRAAARAREELTNGGALPPAVRPDVVTGFVRKYMRPDVEIAAVTEVLERLKDPIFRDAFMNSSVLEACVSVHPDDRVDETLDAIYKEFGTGVVPYVEADGEYRTVLVREDFNMSARRDAYRSCAFVADALRWSPASALPEAEGDLTADEISAAVREWRESFRRLLLELPKVYATDENAAASKPTRRMAAALNGLAKPEAAASGAQYCAALFGVVWEAMFGARVVRSTRAFPGATKLKNLRKAEIEALLDAAGVDRAGLGTHKQLYSALMANKAAFSKSRFRIKRPKWHGWLKPCGAARPAGGHWTSPPYPADRRGSNRRPLAKNERVEDEWT